MLKKLVCAIYQSEGDQRRSMCGKGAEVVKLRHGSVEFGVRVTHTHPNRDVDGIAGHTI